MGQPLDHHGKKTKRTYQQQKHLQTLFFGFAHVFQNNTSKLEKRRDPTSCITKAPPKVKLQNHKVLNRISSSPSLCRSMFRHISHMWLTLVQVSVTQLSTSGPWSIHSLKLTSKGHENFSQDCPLLRKRVSLPTIQTSRCELLSFRWRVELPELYFSY